MDLLIIIKWLTDWSMVDTSNAPSIINIMIDIPLEFGSLVFFLIQLYIDIFIIIFLCIK